MTRRATIAAISTLAAISALGAFSPTVPPTTGARYQLLTKPVLTLDAARAVADAGLARARDLDAGGAIAVVDDAGHLLYLARIDGTFPAASEVAHAKARTAAQFRRPTQDFENAVKGGRNTLLAVALMTPLEGGVPIVVDGQIVGAVGVSGAHSSTEDVQVATAAAAALADATTGSK